MSVRPEFLVQKNISSTCAVTFAIFLDSFTVKLVVFNSGVVLNFKQGRGLKTEFERPRPFRARLRLIVDPGIHTYNKKRREFDPVAVLGTAGPRPKLYGGALT